MADTQVAEEQVSQPSVSEAPVETNWKDSLPDDIRGDASLESVNDINSLAKGYIHAQRMVGADKIAIPGKYGTDEDWQQVYSKLGRPEAPDKYELNYTLPEGDDGANLNQFKEVSHKLGLLPQQAQGILEFYNEMNQAVVKQGEIELNDNRQNVVQGLQKEFGKATDSKIQLAERVAKQFGTPEIFETKLADGTPLGNHPDMIRAFIKIGEAISEDKLNGAPQENVMTPNEAQKEIDVLMGKGQPYWDKGHPNHQRAVDEVARLMQYVVNE
jgi:hypothetical protein